MTNTKLDYYLQAWGLSNPQLLAETFTSHVYTVIHDGETVVLKLLKPVGAEERLGALALRYFDGRGAVRLLREDDDAHLLEYASGEDLTGLVQNGQDEQATAIIAEVIATLHADQSAPPPEGLRTLRRWFQALFVQAEQDRQKGLNTIFMRAAAIADTVLSQQRDLRVLHGDIHHQNIRRSPRGWLLFDPKGVYGERTYDLANTLCNPPPEYGVNAVDEARILHNAAILARVCDIELPRVLLFLHLYACLSASWTLEGHDGGWDITNIITIAEIAERHMESVF